MTPRWKRWYAAAYRLARRGVQAESLAYWQSRARAADAGWAGKWDDGWEAGVRYAGVALD